MNDRSPRRSDLSRWIIRIGLSVMSLVLVFAVVGCSCPEEESTMEQAPATVQGSTLEVQSITEHHLYIRGDDKCRIEDANGHSVIEVKAGDYVVWHNEYGSDVHLNFGPVKRLFGLRQATVYADDSTLTLRINELAEESKHAYTTNCPPEQAGPALIVCPEEGCPE